MSRSVKGKTAIVTGAGSGINLEFARILLLNGVNVLIGDLALRPEAQKLIDDYSGGNITPKAIYHMTDVTSWSDLNSLFQRAKDSFGGFDIVCPGAGVFEPQSSGFWYPPGSENSKDHLEGSRYTSIDINLVHPIRATQLAISHYLSSSSPASQDNLKTIIHVASIAAEIANLTVPLYCAAKWAIRGFIYSMGELEETRHIRVAGVAPGVVRTPLWLDNEDKKAWVTNGAERLLQDDWCTPEEVAEVMYKLCTDNEIRNSRGEKIPIKGGSLIEVIHNDVRDVPVYGAQPPGTGTEMKGVLVSNAAEGWKSMNKAIDEIAGAKS